MKSIFPAIVAATLLLFSGCGGAQATRSTKIKGLDRLTWPQRDVVLTGKRAYEQYCMGCHGANGDGKGPAAAMLLTQPRDFTRGLFKFKQTPSGSLPTDDDLYRIISHGVARTSMPAAFFGGLYWAVPRLTGVPVFSARLGRLLFWAWQLVLVLTMGGILAGYAQGIEWGETPIFVDPLVIVGVVLLSVNFYVPIVKTKEKALYVSLWYFTVAFVWTGLNYIMGNYLPQWFVPGAAGAAISGLFIHDLVGLFVTPLGWGLMYYFVPVILKKPIWSHALSLVGFWALAFFYPLNGVHHYLWSPIPMYVQYGAVTSTVAVEVVVSTVIVNFFMTLRGHGDVLRTSLSMRWFYTGMVFYFTTCLQCAFQVFLTVQAVIHFTDWVVGHAHLVMFGVFGFWILGMITELWPKLVRRAWYSRSLNEWHYWLTVFGMLLMFVDLVAAGLVQGFLWRGLAPWEESIVYSMLFWIIRTVSGGAIIVGQLLFVYNLWRTARAPSSEYEPQLQTSTA